MASRAASIAWAVSSSEVVPSVMEAQKPKPLEQRNYTLHLFPRPWSTLVLQSRGRCFQIGHKMLRSAFVHDVCLFAGRRRIDRIEIVLRTQGPVSLVQ